MHQNIIHRRTSAIALIVGLALAVVLLLVAFGQTAQADTTATPVYKNVSTDVGLGTVPWIRLAYYFGVGQAYGDVNNDGWLDLYLTNHLAENILYMNNGNGTFSISPIYSQVALSGTLSGGATFADYDNDGDQDLFVGNLGINTLYRNDLIENGVLGFTDVTVAAGVGGDYEASITGSWGDYDEDGYLDLYVAHHRCNEPGTACDSSDDQDYLYHNNGDGTFTDVSALLDVSNLIDQGFVAAWTDYDNDGDLDLYLINDDVTALHIGNQLWRNDGIGTNCAMTASDWCFENVSTATNTNTTLCGMGIGIGDYDEDLDLDFIFSNAPPCGPNSPNGTAHMLENLTENSGPTFTDVTVAQGMDIPSVSWGMFFLDFDNDTYRDAYAARMVAKSMLMHNNGAGSGYTFTDMGVENGAGRFGQGAIYGDYDRDGWIDLVTCPRNLSGGCAVFHNREESENGNTNDWLSVRFIGDGTIINRDGVGTRVYVTMSGGRELMQEVKSGSSIGGGNQLALHFGLGTETVTEMKAVWLDGTEQVFTGTITSDTFYTWEYGNDPEVEVVVVNPPSAVSMGQVAVVANAANSWALMATLLLAGAGMVTLLSVRRVRAQR